MGATIGLIDLLEYDLTNQSWNLKFRLPEILEKVSDVTLYPYQATRLKALLEKIKDKEHQKIVKDISKSITFREDDISKNQ